MSNLRLDFKSECLQYSAREILLITKAVTRIPANCSGLIEERIEEVLGHLTEKNDEEVNKIVANITRQIAAASSESADMNESGREVDTKSEVGKFNCMPWIYLRHENHQVFHTGKLSYNVCTEKQECLVDLYIFTNLII